MTCLAITGKIESLDISKIKDMYKDSYIIINLKVKRNYKDKNNNYIYDIIPCLISRNILKAKNFVLKVNDFIGIKGTLEVHNKKVYVVVENTSFLSEIGGI